MVAFAHFGVLGLPPKPLYKRHGLVFTIRQLVYCYKNYRNGYSPFALCRTKVASHVWSFPSFKFGNSINKIVHVPLFAKRASLVCPIRSLVFPPVGRVACAWSFGVARSHIVPGLVALVVGEFASIHRAEAEAEYLHAMNGLYSRAKGGRIVFTSVVNILFEVLVLVCRIIYLVVLFAPAITMAPFVDTFSEEYRERWLHVVRTTLERAGPAFIKWGQWAATRPDLFPADLCRQLSKLHMQAPCHSYAHTKMIIEKAFGRKISDIFDEFEEVPIASGSIAQVHRASLKYSYRGEHMKPIVVAVKVRHLGVGEAIRRDFTIISLVAKVSKFIPALNWLRLDESVQQFAVFMMAQVDLAREAAHLSRFIYNFRSWKDVSFPKPLYPLVHPSVLVETYEQGDSVSHYVNRLQGNKRLKRLLAHIGTHALLKMLLVDNFIHADLHPGNILVRVPNSESSGKKLRKPKPHIIFLDVGMTAELSKSDRVNLLEFFKAVASRDGRTAAESTLRLSKKQSCPDPKAFIEELEATFAFWGTPEGDIFHAAECMHYLLEQVRRHRVNIDGNVCTVMVTFLVLEGWQKELDPEYDVLLTLQNSLFKVDWAESLYYTIERIMSP